MTTEVTDALNDIVKDIVQMQEGLFTDSIWYTLLLGVIVGGIAFLAIKLINRFLVSKSQGNMRFFYRLINACIVTIAVLIVLMTIKPLQDFSKTLLAGSGLLAVIIGIAAQASLGNIFSGISIGLSRPFVIGETIEIIGQDISGVVTEIKLRQTVIRDFNNKHIAIPNSVLDKEIVRTIPAGQASIVNYLSLGIAYGADIEKAIAIIRSVALAHKDFFDIRTKEQIDAGVPADVQVAVMELGDTAVRLRASIWSKDAGIGFMMLSDLRQAILEAFDEAGIKWPYTCQEPIACVRASE